MPCSRVNASTHPDMVTRQIFACLWSIHDFIVWVPNYEGSYIEISDLLAKELRDYPRATSLLLGPGRPEERDQEEGILCEMSFSRFNTSIFSWSRDLSL